MKYLLSVMLLAGCKLPVSQEGIDMAKKVCCPSTPHIIIREGFDSYFVVCENNKTAVVSSTTWVQECTSKTIGAD